MPLRDPVADEINRRFERQVEIFDESGFSIRSAEAFGSIYRSARQAKAVLRRAEDPQIAVSFNGSAARFIGKTPEPRKFVIDRLIPRGVLTLLVSAGGRGKTQFSLQAIVSVTADKLFCGYGVSPGNALGLFCEDDDNELHLRLRQICGALDVDFDTIAAHINPISCVDRNVVLWDERAGPTKAFTRLEARLASDRADLLIIDGSAYTYAGNENDRGAVTRFCAALNGLAARFNIAIVLVTHESKSSANNDTHAASGSTAWLNAARSVLKLDLDKDDQTKRILRQIKTNRGRAIAPLVLRAAGGIFTPLSMNDARRQACWDFVEHGLTMAVLTGENLSPNKRAGNYAGRVISKRQTAVDDEARFSVAEVSQVLDLLIGSRFGVEDYRSNGKDHKRIIATENSFEPSPGGSDAE